ncbi:hypothetical protein I3843_01G109600 [Carya illinoinensis]|nr:hypothetical protein I3843_01G109600 [Carya illinoinensis]
MSGPLIFSTFPSSFSTYSHCFSLQNHFFLPSLCLLSYLILLSSFYLSFFLSSLFFDSSLFFCSVGFYFSALLQVPGVGYLWENRTSINIFKKKKEIQTEFIQMKPTEEEKGSSAVWERESAGCLRERAPAV